jgi:hypothetical protein
MCSELDGNCSDWVALQGRQVDGCTSVLLKRKLITGDQQDRDVVPGSMKLLWAYGTSDAVSYHQVLAGP